MMADRANLVDEVDAQTIEREGAPRTHPEFDRLVRTIWRLRQPDGCPWDRVQTHASIARNLIEEAYEAVQCIADGDETHLREELGDVLEQVLLHAQIASDGGVAGQTDRVFDIDDVCCDLNQKLIRRHPHVFGDPASVGALDCAGQVLDIWDAVKQRERVEDTGAPGLLDSVPISLPALAQCQKISKRVAKVGFDWDSVDDIWTKVFEERAEYEAEEPGSKAAQVEFGDLLFALVNVARRQGVDAEAALGESNRKFRKRWARLEALARAEGSEVEDLKTEQLNELWERVKIAE